MSFLSREFISGVSTRAAVFYIAISGLIGVAAGLGLFTFGYADGAAYLTSRPEACANCHVMQRHLDAWVKSSHAKFAVCNDCHAPHSFVGKYLCKVRNGFFHSLAFTTGAFPDNIRLTPYNRRVLESACRDCHESIVDQIDHPAGDGQITPVSCLHCHKTVGHDT
jgi:cytochrome c nitrite reductase small subunit